MAIAVGWLVFLASALALMYSVVIFFRRTMQRGGRPSRVHALQIQVVIFLLFGGLTFIEQIQYSFWWMGQGTLAALLPFLFLSLFLIWPLQALVAAGVWLYRRWLAR